MTGMEMVHKSDGNGMSGKEMAQDRYKWYEWDGNGTQVRWIWYELDGNWTSQI